MHESIHRSESPNHYRARPFQHRLLQSKQHLGSPLIYKKTMKDNRPNIVHKRHSVIQNQLRLRGIHGGSV